MTLDRHQGALVTPRAVDVLRGLALEHVDGRDERDGIGVHGFCLLRRVVVGDVLLGLLLDGILLKGLLLRCRQLDFTLWCRAGRGIGVVRWRFDGRALGKRGLRRGGLGVRFLHFEG